MALGLGHRVVEKRHSPLAQYGTMVFGLWDRLWKTLKGDFQEENVVGVHFGILEGPVGLLMEHK